MSYEFYALVAPSMTEFDERLYFEVGGIGGDDVARTILEGNLTQETESKKRVNTISRQTALEEPMVFSILFFERTCNVIKCFLFAWLTFDHCGDNRKLLSSH